MKLFKPLPFFSGLTAIALLIIFSLGHPLPVHAISCGISNSSFSATETPVDFSFGIGLENRHGYNIDLEGDNPGSSTLQNIIANSSGITISLDKGLQEASGNGQPITERERGEANFIRAFSAPQTFILKVIRRQGGVIAFDQEICRNTITITPSSDSCSVTINNPPDDFFQVRDNVEFTVNSEQLKDFDLFTQIHNGSAEQNNPECGKTSGSGEFSRSIEILEGFPGTWHVQAFARRVNISAGGNTPCLPAGNSPLCFADLQVGSSQTTDPNGAPLGSEAKAICEKTDNPDECERCVRGRGGAYTALGCIPVGNLTDFLAWILRFAAGIGGGLTFLLVVYGGFRYVTSAGNPETVAEAREIITNAIAGLLLILFSAILLRIIGVDILQIPGFATP